MFTEHSTFKYEIKKQWNSSNTMKLKFISNLMNFGFIIRFLSNVVQNIKWVNVLKNLRPGHLDNIIISPDPCHLMVGKEINIAHLLEGHPVSKIQCFNFILPYLFCN